MITAPQLRAARGMMDWTRADLAQAAGVSPETIKNIEHGTFRPQEATADAIIRAFSAHDIEFIDNDGVRKRKDSVHVLHGAEGFKAFMDNVYEVCKNEGETNTASICVSGVDERQFEKFLGDYAQTHAQRMNQLSNVKSRVIIGHDDTYTVVNASFIDYRRSNAKLNETVPFYVYGNRLAIITFNNGPQVTIIDSKQVADAYRHSFELLWNTAFPL